MADESEAETVVIFRRWTGKHRGILALFPLDDCGNGHCGSYEHVGQHSGADYAACIAATRPAQPAEYVDLKRELEGIGYKLKIVQRRPAYSHSKGA